jgi:excisionase family DNA binding protein
VKSKTDHQEGDLEIAMSLIGASSIREQGSSFMNKPWKFALSTRRAAANVEEQLLTPVPFHGALAEVTANLTHSSLSQEGGRLDGLGEPWIECLAIPLSLYEPMQDHEAVRSDLEVMMVEEVATWLRVNRKTVYEAIHRGELPALVLGAQFRVSRVAVLEWASRPAKRSRR